MKILIVEDDLISRKFLSKFLSKYGECDITVDGIEAIDAFLLAWEDEEPYDLICLDIMMPKVDGIVALKTIRSLEIEKGIPQNQRVKIIMTTALNDTKNVHEAFQIGCEGYAAKPIDTNRLIEVLEKLKLIDEKKK
ncbi:response regulator [Marinisporobacter balticus]|uniref:Stage 0 sporulation protein A homolog n=1 Tax=Marinisporobacter balticus TaxID=2018667 RepID=A0A4R2L260_9FIRM|nr:response regulator [Marinisporobacter balticus]TCO73135.1 two-component system chemotaxis response regulator CheY [Marinisporobacter balticus]